MHTYGDHDSYIIIVAGMDWRPRQRMSARRMDEGMDAWLSDLCGLVFGALSEPGARRSEHHILAHFLVADTMGLKFSGAATK